jgi:hypothetical protein
VETQNILKHGKMAKRKFFLNSSRLFLFQTTKNHQEISQRENQAETKGERKIKTTNKYFSLDVLFTFKVF